MISIAVRVETECGTCRMPMPVNTLAREVGCQCCGRPTALGGDLWQALFRDPVYEGPKMLQNEGRRRLAGKLSVAFTRRGPCCQGCEKEIPVVSVLEVRDQAMLRCDRCATQTWVRRVPTEFGGALPNITHLVGEDPDPLVEAPADGAQAETFPCPQCGSPVAFDGVNRACTCRFCSTRVHVPDEFVYRGRRKVAASWFLCFHSSIADGAPTAHAVAAGLFDWESELPEATVDAEGNLYCAISKTYGYLDENRAPRTKIETALWSLDSSLNIRWLQRDRREPVRFMCCLDDRLLLSAGEKWSPHWLSSSTGTPVETPGIAASTRDVDLPSKGYITCSRDGSLLIYKHNRIKRFAPNGDAVPVWSDDTRRKTTDAVSIWNWNDPSDRPIELNDSIDVLYCGPDGSLYMLRDSDCGELARFDGAGRTIYCVQLPDRAPQEKHGVIGADLHGNAYIVRDNQVVRVGAAGEQSVVLYSDRDNLPKLNTRIAVCPDGSFWLFGVHGFAWKFGPNGRLLFVSKEEPETTGGRADAEMKARLEEIERLSKLQARKYSDLVESALEEKRRANVLGCVGAAVIAAVVLLLTWLFVGTPGKPGLLG